MFNSNEVDIKRRKFIGTQRKYKVSSTNIKYTRTCRSRGSNDCTDYVECDVAPIAFSCIVTIPHWSVSRI